jgi:hypothetical protein
MALTEEDFAALGRFIDSKFESKAAEPAPEPSAEQVAQDRVSVVGKPDTDPEAGPEFYVHLANGNVVKSFDSSSSHLPDSEGVSQLVIGRYQVGE